MTYITRHEIDKGFHPIFDWLEHLGIPYRVYLDDKGIYRFHYNKLLAIHIIGHMDDIALIHKQHMKERDLKERVEIYTMIGISLDVFWDVFCEEIGEFQHNKECK